MSAWSSNNAFARRDYLIAMPVCLCALYVLMRFIRQPMLVMAVPGIVLLLLLLGPVVLYRPWALWVNLVFYFGQLINALTEASVGTPWKFSLPSLGIWGLLLAAVLIRRFRPLQTT